MKKQLNDAIKSYIKKNYSLNMIVSYFELNNINYAFIGDSVRLLIENKPVEYFSIVADCPQFDIDNIVYKYKLDAKKRKKAYQIIDNQIIDLCTLSYMKCDTLKELQNIAMINCSSAVYCPIKSKLHKKYFKEYLKTQTVCFVNKPDNDKPLYMAELYKLAENDQLRFSGDVLAMMLHHIYDKNDILRKGIVKPIAKAYYKKYNKKLPFFIYGTKKLFLNSYSKIYEKST